MKTDWSKGVQVSTASLAINSALALIKLTAGVTGNSYALIADAIESLGDMISSTVVWTGLVLASKPADKDHPYGHGKAEPLAALAVAIMLVGSAFLIAWQAIEEIRTPHQPPAAFTLIVLLLVVVVKESMYRYESRTGRQIGSTAVLVDAWHHRSDAITSAAAGIGIATALLGGPGFEPADDWAALVACVIITFNAVHLSRTAISELMDTAPDSLLPEAIVPVAASVSGAKRVEKLLIRKMGPAYYVDLHLEVDGQLSVDEAHAISHKVKDAVLAHSPQIADVLVHIEPFKPQAS
ncbi:MAG: cation diffusion facilitator family transporter [Planctomycetota bacterium]